MYIRGSIWKSRFEIAAVSTRFSGWRVPLKRQGRSDFAPIGGLPEYEEAFALDSARFRLNPLDFPPSGFYPSPP
jgi:hypothetical protein